MENFNLRKFLVENKLTAGSRMLNESVANIVTDDEWEYDFASLKDSPDGVEVYYPNPDTEEMEYKYTIQASVDRVLQRLTKIGAIEKGRSAYYATDEEAIIDTLENLQ